MGVSCIELWILAQKTFVIGRFVDWVRSSESRTPQIDLFFPG